MASKHGMARTDEYGIYHGMIKRCFSVNYKGYERYGAKGITVCDRWVGEGGFINFISDMGLRPTKQHSLDRYPDMNGNYSPENCRWATDKEQSQNRYTSVWIEYNGIKMVMSDWANHFGVTQGGFWNVYNRIKDVDGVMEYYENRDRMLLEKKSSSFFEYDGMAMGITEWARHLGVERASIRWWIKKGKPFSEIVSLFKEKKELGIENTHWIEFNGERKMVCEWAKDFNVTPSTIGHHFRSGKTFDKIFEFYRKKNEKAKI